MDSSAIAEKEVLSDDHGVVSIMYHRFNENKYPSTNIKVFLKATRTN